MLACQNGNLDIVENLLKHNADTEIKARVLSLLVVKYAI